MNLDEKALEAANDLAREEFGVMVGSVGPAYITAYISALLPEDAQGLVERLLDISQNDDHARGCQGRQYTCSCGFDDRSFATADQAASLIQSQAARIAGLEAVLRTTRTLVSEAALTGFNCHEGKWAEQLYANQATISKMVDLPRRTLPTKDRLP